MELIYSNIVKTDAMCVKIFGNIIFIGSGYYLNVHCKQTKSIKEKIYVFDENIFGVAISENTNKLLVHGGKCIKIYDVDFTNLKFQETAFYMHSDWILSAKFINGDYIIGITMHNFAILWNSTLDIVERKECAERCVSFCACIVNDNWSDAIVLSGTVFNQILLWWPAKSSNSLCTVICRLVGHKGVVFSIDYHPTLNIICTTSDDRTAKIWSIKNESLNKELGQNPIAIDLKYDLISHTARVFKCKILKDSIITAGEDGVVNVWSLNGELIRKIDVHQGGSVWSVDHSEETNEIVTGGGDCGVTLHKLNLTVSKLQVDTYNCEIPKRIVILSHGDLAYLTVDGLLILYNVNSKIFTVICAHDDLKSYGLLEKSPCGSSIALAGYHGSIHIYKYTPGCLEYMYECQIKSKERIFSLHWLGCSALLSCGAKGVLVMWNVTSDTMFPIHFMKLPLSKEQWSTAASFCGSGHILVGDRRGSLSLYSLESSQPVQVIKRAHNYLGISNIYFSDGKVASLGRNSTINEYEFNEKNQRITPITFNKVPFSWLVGLYRTKSSRTSFLVGFSGTNVIVYDHIDRRTILEYDCGGGHRSWDFHLTNKCLTFSYIKDKHINMITVDVADLQGTNVIEGYHLNEINVLNSIKIDEEQWLLVSGGEDTILRLCSVDFKSATFKNLTGVKSHLSSIRTIAVVEIEGDEKENKYFMFSGGGRSQILMWELSISKNGGLMTNCEKFNYYEAQGKEDLETRIMALCIATVEDVIYLLAGCSDGKVKVFKVTSENGEQRLICINSLPLYESKCILKISTILTANFIILITMATDGYIVLSNITDILNEPSSNLTKNELIISSIKANQSGINSFSYYSPSDNNFIFLTGGDDSAFTLNAVVIKACGQTLKIEHLARYSDEGYHGAQVTGAHMTDKYFLTASVDQQVLLFKWSFSEDVFNVECVYRYNTSICDIHGMECVVVNDDVKTFVYGRGCEWLTVKLIS